MSEPVSVLLFDLGGVLVDFSGHEELQGLLPERLEVDALTAAWHACPHSLAYGAGALSTADFIPRFRRDWRIALDDEPFLNAWQSWVRGWLPGAGALLDELRPRFRLAALSNSNPAHWERLAEMGVLAAFEQAFGSHQLGVRKPDALAFHQAVERLGVRPEAVLFFDDSDANVEAAIAAGLRAARADGPAAVRRQLVDAGLMEETGNRKQD
jgi:FMN phosphatase YigB (HAD superfamily)